MEHRVCIGKQKKQTGQNINNNEKQIIKKNESAKETTTTKPSAPVEHMFHRLPQAATRERFAAGMKHVVPSIDAKIFFNKYIICEFEKTAERGGGEYDIFLLMRLQSLS